MIFRMSDSTTLTLEQAQALCESAARRSGAIPEVARAIANAAVRAESEGQSSVGLSHFMDYLDALLAGRLDGCAEPAISRPAPTILVSDARKGAAHTGFERAFDDLVATARDFGLAAFCQHNSFSCGALGYFVARLAEENLAAFAATNGPAVLAGSGTRSPVFSTNPLAFAAPVAGSPPLIIDQSSSSTAFVNIRQAAQESKMIPEGWALDSDGNPTTDPQRAMTGALLAFGGPRGANIALMVEVLAAGLTGANWSLEVNPITHGHQSPGCGLFVLAINPAIIDRDFPARLGRQMLRLSVDFDVHFPGIARAQARAKAQTQGIIVNEALYRRIAAHSGS